MKIIPESAGFNPIHGPACRPGEHLNFAPFYILVETKMEAHQIHSCMRKTLRHTEQASTAPFVVAVRHMKALIARAGGFFDSSPKIDLPSKPCCKKLVWISQEDREAVHRLLVEASDSVSDLRFTSAYAQTALCKVIDAIYKLLNSMPTEPNI